MKPITTSVLLILFALFTAMTTVSIVGCDNFSLDDPKVVELEGRISKLEKEYKALGEEYYKLAGQYNKLVDVNRVLIQERDMYKQDRDDFAVRIQTLSRKLATIEADKSKTFTVNFDNNKLYNKQATNTIAKEALAFARKHDFKVKLKVEGYSSHNGDAKYNMWVSKERAEGVLHKIMSDAGNDAIKFSHTHVIAYGEESDNERKVVITIEVL